MAINILQVVFLFAFNAQRKCSLDDYILATDSFETQIAADQIFNVTCG
jgi:hypothetical protein